MKTRSILLVLFVLLSLILVKAQELNIMNTKNWNTLKKSGFYQSQNTENVPANDASWYWGINIGHSSNTSTIDNTYNFNGQILIPVNFSDYIPRLYFRSTNRNGAGRWAQVLHNLGNQNIDGNLNVNGNIQAKQLSLDNQLIVGKQVDPVNFGSIDRIKIIPYRNTGGPWIIRSRDAVGISNLDLLYGGNNLVSFHHNYKVDINGSLRAKEVKVEAVSWSDFVFDKDYKLPSLEVVEAYINENKHLPDIPKESEVKEKGINVAEMQAKLLQKIEELTLYMIEQNKLNKEQAKQIQNQSKEIEELKRQIKSN